MKIRFLKYFKIDWPYRSYQIWVINTTLDCRLYLWDNWRLLLPLLDTIVQLTDEQAFIRTYQAYPLKNQWLAFGRMKWNEENNIKWTTKYRPNKPGENEPEFFNTEIWAPDWNKVCNTGMPPDVFICLYNYPKIVEVKEGITVALPLSIYKTNKPLVDEILIRLVTMVKGARLHIIKRSWWGRTGSRNNIEDMTIHELKEIMKQ